VSGINIKGYYKIQISASQKDLRIGCSVEQPSWLPRIKRPLLTAATTACHMIVRGHSLEPLTEQLQPHCSRRYLSSPDDPAAQVAPDFHKVAMAGKSQESSFWLGQAGSTNFGPRCIWGYLGEQGEQGSGEQGSRGNSPTLISRLPSQT